MEKGNKMTKQTLNLLIDKLENRKIIGHEMCIHIISTSLNEAKIMYEIECIASKPT